VPFKANIFRIAALHLHGGYYLDFDIQVMTALDLPPDVDFVTVKMEMIKMFFQAFLAAPARPPILKSALESMLNDSI